MDQCPGMKTWLSGGTGPAPHSPTYAHKPSVPPGLAGAGADGAVPWDEDLAQWGHRPGTADEQQALLATGVQLAQEVGSSRCGSCGVLGSGFAVVVGF